MFHSSNGPVSRLRAAPLATVLTALAIGLPWAAASATAQEKAAAPAGPAVSTITASSGRIRDVVTVGGTLVARDEVLVAAQIDGLAIVEILVDEGAHVRAGDVLARLSRETIDILLEQNSAQLARVDAAIAQAKAQIAEAEAARVAAVNSFERAKDLRQGGITTAETYDQRNSLAKQTAARVTSAEQALKLAQADKAVALAQRDDYELRLVRTEIKATVDGIVSRRTARLGAIAAGASDPLFRLIGNGMIELEADIAEATLARLKTGQPAKVRPAGATSDIEAKIRLISPEVSRTTRLGRVRLALAEADGLAIGAFARGEIEVAAATGIVLPLSAVQFGAEGARVQVVVGGAVETRPVATGLRSSTQVEIVSGLQAGEQVVSLAGTFLRNGDRVTPVPQPALSN